MDARDPTLHYVRFSRFNDGNYLLLTKAVPSSLVAILTVTALVHVVGLDSRTVIDFVRSMSGNPNATLAGSLPTFALPEVGFNLETLRIILPYSLILAAVGLIESLLTLTVIDEMTGTRGHGNRECMDRVLPISPVLYLVLWVVVP